MRAVPRLLKRWIGPAFSLLLLWAFLAGCGGEADAGDGATGKERTLTVFAAASLTDAFEEMKEIFEERNPGVEVRLNFAASSALLVQIQQGAPADVFASADEAKMESAVEDGLVSGDPVVFATNRLVIVVKQGLTEVREYRDLAKPGMRIVLAQEGVPVAGYAAESLERADARYGEGFGRDVLSNVVSREADVRAAVNRVALGEADATFAYSSDVTPDVEDKVREIEIPGALNVVATYPISSLRESRSPALADEWVGLVTGEEGRRVLAKWGFGAADKG